MTSALRGGSILATCDCNATFVRCPPSNRPLRQMKESPPYPFADDDADRDSSRRSSNRGGGGHLSHRNQSASTTTARPGDRKISLPYGNQPV